jgi:hypothetical protein
MTLRYAYLSSDHTQAAVKTLEKVLALFTFHNSLCRLSRRRLTKT